MEPSRSKSEKYAAFVEKIAQDYTDKIDNTWKLKGDAYQHLVQTRYGIPDVRGWKKNGCRADPYAVAENERRCRTYGYRDALPVIDDGEDFIQTLKSEMMKKILTEKFTKSGLNFP